MIPVARLSNRRAPALPVGERARAALGVLSIHLDGAPCRVGCEFCYLGARAGDAERPLDLGLVEELLARLDYAEVAVAVSEPGAAARTIAPSGSRAAARRRKPVALTTTPAVLRETPALADGVARINLSIDPRKGPVAPAWIASVAEPLRAPGRELVLILTLASHAFADALIAGGLAALLELPSVDKIALSALKPPPDWCDRAFWLRACARLAPLLARHLDQRLFLDCQVAARILGLGPCPARPDVSPGNAFRSCVYQPRADFAFSDADDLTSRLADFVAPSACPFPIP
jgi:hypothetical protein